MALGTLYMTAPAVAAAVGIYFFDKYKHYSNSKELGDGLRSSSSSMANMAAAGKKSSNEMPKLAPQFDGLNCFESLVSC